MDIYSVFKLILIVACSLTFVESQACRGLLDASTDPPTCYTYHNTARTHSDALSECEATGGRTLARIADLEQHNIIKDLVESEEGIGSAPFYVWIGGRIRIQDPVDIWRWTQSNTESSGQGCYYQYEGNNPSNWRDFATDKTSEVPEPMRPDSCIAVCRDGGYSYAGLQNGNECWCDNGFGKWGGQYRGNRCIQNCPQTNGNSIRCGGTNANDVYAVDGAYSNWGYAKPNNYTGYQACAVMSSGVSYKFDDEDCHVESSRSYICQIDIGSCSGSESDGFYTSRDGKCYYVREANADVNWFQAREMCIELGGDLVSISSQEEFDFLDEQVRHDTVYMKYWIGLSSRVWEWTTGDEMKFYKWRFERPSNKDGMCVVYTYDGAFSGWEEDMCTSAMPYVCQYVDPSLTTSITTSTTTTPSTTTTTPLTTSTTTTPPTTTQLRTTTTTPTTTTATTTPSTTIITLRPTIAATATRSTTTTAQTTTPSSLSATTTIANTTPTTTSTTETTATPQPRTTTTTTIISTSSTRPSSPLTVSPMMTSTVSASDETTTMRSGSGGPNAGQATGNKNNNGGLNTLELVLIIFVVILVLLVIIMVVVLCIVKRKNQQSNQIADDTVDEDREKPPVYTGYNLDDWYSNMANSSTGLVDIPRKTRRHHSDQGSIASANRSRHGSINIADD